MTFDEDEVKDALGMTFSGDELDMPPEQFDSSASDPMDTTLALADAPQAGPLTQMRPQMAQAGASDVTLTQRAEAARDPGGFDWARAFWAAGGGDLGSFDAERARKQARQDKQIADFDARQLVKDGMDPQSSMSRARQQEYAQTMATRAQIAQDAGMGQLAKMFSEQAQMAPTMSATQIERASQNYGGLMKESMSAMDMMARQQLAKQGLDLRQRSTEATEQIARGNQGLKAAELSGRREDREMDRELRREMHHDSLLAKKEAAEEKKRSALPAGEQVAKYNERKVAENEINQALKLLPGVTYTGVGAETANNIMSKDPTGLLDKRSDADRQFVGLLNSLRAKARNKIFGAALSKYDISDAESFLASLGTNKQTIAANLQRLLKAAQDENSMEEQYYPGLIRGGHSSAAPSQSRDPRIELAKKALADPSASEEHKAAAKRILEKAGQ